MSVCAQAGTIVIAYQPTLRENIWKYGGGVDAMIGRRMTSILYYYYNTGIRNQRC